LDIAPCGEPLAAALTPFNSGYPAKVPDLSAALRATGWGIRQLDPTTALFAGLERLQQLADGTVEAATSVSRS
jgi:hypothetical protein